MKTQDYNQPLESIFHSYFSSWELKKKSLKLKLKIFLLDNPLNNQIEQKQKSTEKCYGCTAFRSHQTS